jgi:hypothetical protein
VDIPRVTPPRVTEGLEPISFDPLSIEKVKIVFFCVKLSREEMEDCFRSSESATKSFARHKKTKKSRKH